MSQHITTTLVEQVARRRQSEKLENIYRQGLAGYAPADLLNQYDNLPPHRRRELRETVFVQLQTIVPALLEAGWLPPNVANEIREEVSASSLTDFHQRIMAALEASRSTSGYESNESVYGYSEGSEHGAALLAGRISKILDGAA